LARRPTVGLLGVASPQAEPDLAAHHEGFLAQVGRRLATAADIISGPAASSGEQLTGAIDELERLGADGIALVMLGTTPPEDCAEAFDHVDLPLLIANVQPERSVGSDWSDYDFRFNGGVGAAQRLAGELVSAGVRFSALTGDWLSDRFATEFGDWARAGQTLAAVADVADEELLERAAATLLDSTAGCRLAAMDWNQDALLLAPSPGLAATPGPMTTAALAQLEAGGRRLVVGSGELLAVAEQQGAERVPLLFAPDVGLEAFMDAWLELGSPAEFVVAMGDRHERWRRLAEMLEIEYEEI
jgi:L-arabinose isomerase